jgi:hypothetical protein
MIKKLLVVFVFAFTIQTYAQEGVASPYSYYGIGSLKFKGSVENKSMGGIGVYKDSIHINFKNPATLAGKNLAYYNNESRPVTYVIGGNSNHSALKSSTSEGETSTQTFDYLALSVPIGKFGVSLGLLPYTSVGYSLDSFNEVGDISRRYEGSGGINKTFLSLGYPINDNLSVGITTEYNFGKIKNKSIQFPYDAATGDPLLYRSREENRSDLSGVSFNFGLHYKRMISDKLELQASTTFAPQSKLNSQNVRNFSTIAINNRGAELVINSIDADLVSRNLEETKLTLPSKFSLGAGVGQPRKWFAGVEFLTQNTSQFSNPLYNYENTTFENASSIALGGFFIPKYNSFSSYFKRVVYRTGVRFENTGLKINNQSIKEFGMSFGLGLPVGVTFSNVNLGIEFGSRGTTNSNLIKENFINLKISLSLNDRWFEKRKYN